MGLGRGLGLGRLLGWAALAGLLELRAELGRAQLRVDLVAQLRVDRVDVDLVVGEGPQGAPG